MHNLSEQKLIALDHAHVWHPYSAMGSGQPVYPVVSATGVRLTLADGRELIDGMSSWWSAIHGYNHPVMNHALQAQMGNMAHVMFGGLTHPPAVELAQQLVALTPASLQTVFFADSGSVAVEVAMKMAIQYWHAKGQPDKQRFATLRHGYHGDTFAAMSVCDPVAGMHTLFSDVLTRQFFVDTPQCRFGEPCTDAHIASLVKTLETEHPHIAALILEPIVQGAGGMRFYSADYLKKAHALCNEHNVLLIFDEIATGFGRTGKLFACEYANIAPDILCLGKALTGGYLTLAATLTTNNVAETISTGKPGLFMHGPTFMANPLACAAGLASLQLLRDTPWQQNVQRIARSLETGLAPCRAFESVADVRVLGAIGVIELHHPVEMKTLQPRFVDAGVWVRPFGKLIYLMPPFIINDNDLTTLTQAVTSIIADLS
ncbi:MAG: adenosylmethionine--8-amino-7-oxononanoate transaminase [Gammaproteobacteria bacterium]|nr:adenosylmethionine--8-amino-7-oxononanoate transaminase [Gammaproteobacteria bacterium]